MIVRSTGRLFALAALAASAPALATDAPHDNSSAPRASCQGCHVAHSSPGASLTRSEINATLCGSCHLAGLSFGFPWNKGDQGLPGASGRSHAWSGPPSSPRHGSETPLDPTLVSHLRDGEIECNTCHNPHNAAKANGGRQHVSAATGTPLTHAAGTGTGKMTLAPPGAAAIAKGYRIQIGPSAGEFRISHDANLSVPSWFGWDSSAQAWGAGLAAGRPFSAGAAVALDDPALTVTFDSGAFAVGDRWDFYVSYPFLRVSNVNDATCEDCHRSRVQSRLDVEGKPGGRLPSIVPGTTRFSHPTGSGVTIPATAAYHAPFDADGSPQTPGDGVATNDLVLDGSSQVRCTTCHRMHDADSNSLSEDGR